MLALSNFFSLKQFTKIFTRNKLATVAEATQAVEGKETLVKPAFQISKISEYLPLLLFITSLFSFIILLAWLMLSLHYDNLDLKKQLVKSPAEQANIKLALTIKPIVRVLQENSTPARAVYFSSNLKTAAQQLEINQILSTALKRTPDVLDYAYADLKGKVLYSNIEEIKGLSLNFFLSAIAPGKNNSAIASSELITLPISKRIAIAFARPVLSSTGETVGFSVALLNIRQLEKLVLPKSVGSLSLATISLSSNNQVIAKVPNASKLVKIGEQLKGLEEIQNPSGDQDLFIENINFDDKIDRMVYSKSNSEIPLAVSFIQASKNQSTWRANNYFINIVFISAFLCVLLSFAFYRLYKNIYSINKLNQNIVVNDSETKNNDINNSLVIENDKISNIPLAQHNEIKANNIWHSTANNNLNNDTIRGGENINNKENQVVQSNSNNIETKTNLPNSNFQSNYSQYAENIIKNLPADNPDLANKTPNTNKPDDNNFDVNNIYKFVENNLNNNSKEFSAQNNINENSPKGFLSLENSQLGKGKQLAKSALNVYRQMLDTVTEAQQLSDRSNFNPRNEDNKNETMLTELPLVGFNNKQQYKPVSKFMVSQGKYNNAEGVNSVSQASITGLKPNQFKVKISRQLSPRQLNIDQSSDNATLLNNKFNQSSNNISENSSNNISGNSSSELSSVSSPSHAREKIAEIDLHREKQLQHNYLNDENNKQSVPDLILKRNKPITSTLLEQQTSTTNKASTNIANNNLNQIENQQEENKIVEWDNRALLQGSSILLVDDNNITAQLISGMLDWLGCKVTLAQDGQDALDKLESQIFEVVLMDIRMPRMDGLSATRAIRAMLGKVGKIPIIGLVSESNIENEGETCLKIGMNGFISKSVDMQLLGHELSKHIKPIEDQGLRRLMEHRLFNTRSA